MIHKKSHIVSRAPRKKKTLLTQNKREISGFNDES